MIPLSPVASALPAPPLELSVALRALSERCRDRSPSLGEVIDSLGAGASALLIIVCALPFLTPVMLPGLSTPFGVAILLLSGRYLLGRPPWLPRRLRRVILPGALLVRVLAASSRLLGWLERWLVARWHPMVDSGRKRRLHMSVVVLSALLLMLPLPPIPPFTNVLPALVVIVMTFSTSKRDGVGVVAGYALFALTLAYFAFWATVLRELVLHHAAGFFSF